MTGWYSSYECRIYLLKGSVSIQPFQYFGTQGSILKIITFRGIEVVTKSWGPTQSHQIITILTNFPHYLRTTQTVRFVSVETGHTECPGKILQSVSPWCEHGQRDVSCFELSVPSELLTCSVWPHRLIVGRKDPKGKSLPSRSRKGLWFCIWKTISWRQFSLIQINLLH